MTGAPGGHHKMNNMIVSAVEAPYIACRGELCAYSALTSKSTVNLHGIKELWYR